jgi:uncharacterized protein (UPF0332 family)
MVSELPEEFLEQAKFLLTLSPSQANLRRAVSTAYYGLFHLLVRAMVVKWSSRCIRHESQDSLNTSE